MLPFTSVLIFCIVLCGTVGNILSLVVWIAGRRSCNTSGAVYFKLLASVDLFLLCVNGTEYLLRTGFEIFIQDYHDIICRVFFFVDDCAPQLSAWLAVTLTVERMVHICYPLKFYRFNTRKRAYIVFTVILIFSFCLNILCLVAPALVSFEGDLDDFYTLDYYTFDQNETFLFCDFSDKYRNIHYTVSSISYAGFTFLLPLILIVICNLSTLYALYHQKENFPANETRQRSVRNMTKIVFCVGALHCVSTLPRGLYWFLLRVGTKIPDKYNRYIKAVGNVCYFLNSGFNFVFYCLFGNEFRKDMKELMCIRSTARPRVSVLDEGQSSVVITR